MSDGSTDSSSDNREVIAAEVRAEVDRRLEKYRNWARGFVVGLGLLIILLIGQGLISKESFLRWAHDQVFGFDSRLRQALSKNVAVSYSGYFVLGHEEGLESSRIIGFYADESQEVDLYLDLTRDGTGPSKEVYIKLDDIREPIYTTTKEAVLKESLNKYLEISRKADVSLDVPVRQFGRPSNVHFLEIGAQDTLGESTERIVVQILVNVNGTGKESSLH